MKGLSNKISMPGFIADLPYEWKRYYRNITKVSESNPNLTPAQDISTNTPPQYSPTFDYDCYNKCTDINSPTEYCQGLYHEYMDQGHPELYLDYQNCEDIKDQKCREYCSTQGGANTSTITPQPDFHPQFLQR